MQVTILSKPAEPTEAELREQQLRDEMARASLMVLSGEMSIFQAMHKLVDAAASAQSDSNNRSKDVPGTLQVSVPVQAKQPYELFFEVRVRGDDQYRVDGDETVRDNMHDWLGRTPHDAPASPLRQIMEIMDKGDR